VESAERDAGAEAQAARKTVARFVRREFRLVCLLDRTAEALFKAERWSWRQRAVRRAAVSRRRRTIQLRLRGRVVGFKDRSRRDCKGGVDLSFAFVAQEPFKLAEELGG
jgi:hypothetical protein